MRYVNINFLKNEIVERISKIIELKDMVIVRYKNSFSYTRYIYIVYLKNGGCFRAYTYTELLDSIAIIRLFN